MYESINESLKNMFYEDERIERLMPEYEETPEESFGCLLERERVRMATERQRRTLTAISILVCTDIR